MSVLVGRSRPERVEQVRGLLELSMTHREIADALGISRSYVRDLIYDPNGHNNAVRKARTGGTCALCGTRTTYIVGGAAKHCAACAPIAAKTWTKDAIRGAIRTWAAWYGEPPGATDWNPAQARSLAGERADEITARFYANVWPYTYTVQCAFGSWNAAIRSAGFKPRRAGIKRGDTIIWTRAMIVAALRDWAAAHGGDPPTVADWAGRRGEFPSIGPVRDRFGSWNAAILAAGLTPRRLRATR